MIKYVRDNLLLGLVFFVLALIFGGVYYLFAGEKSDKYIKTIDGIPCNTIVEDDVKYYNNGNLKSCPLGKEFKLNNIELYPKNASTTVFMNTNKKIDYIHIKYIDSLLINGILCKCYFLDNDNETFYIYPIYFHPNGKLKKCTLHRGMTIENIQYKEGDTVCFDEKGKLVQCE